MLISLSCLAARVNAQSPEQLDLTTIGQDPQWKIANRAATAMEIKGKRAVKLSEGSGMGVVWLEGYDFVNGVIDIDILGRSEPVQGSFVGVVFRAINAETHDAVYFRPFNFRATDLERRSHAVQYVSHPKYPWQVLRSEHPGEYERAVIPEVNGDEWFHARVVVERPQVSVFVNETATPCLVIKELSNRNHGSLGIWVGEGSGGSFANLQVTRSR